MVFMRLNEFRIFLAYRESDGVNNQVALAQIIAAFNLIRPDDQKLAISPSMQSRLKAGHRATGDKHSKLLRAIEEFLAARGDKINKEMGLQEFLAEVSHRPEVLSVLHQYDLQVAKKHHLAKPAKHETHDIETPKYRDEDLSLLLGVWQQINFTCATIAGLTNPLLRFAVKLVYLDEAKRLRTFCIGKSTRWDGEVSLVKENIHVSEKARDQHWGEPAHYVYKVHTENRKLVALHGFVQVVSHYAPKHIFSGRTILLRSDELTNKYKNQLQKFQSDSNQLHRDYCGHFDESELDKSEVGIQNIGALVEKFLKIDGRRSIDIVEM